MTARQEQEMVIGMKAFGMAVALTVCLLFKWSLAGADALRLDWLLGPTSSIVSLLTGMRFDFIGAEGYYNAEQAILIAPACSGLNFFIILLATGGCLAVCLLRTGARQPLVFPLIAALAYVFTLAVNTVRILLAILLYRHEPGGSFISPEQLHRVEGVVVYYVCLCLFVMLISALLRGRSGRGASSPARDGKSGKTAPAGLLSRPLRIFLPLGCYLLFTLGVPLANGAASKAPRLFAEHSLTVLLLSAGISLALFLLCRKKGRGARIREKDQTHETENTHC